MPTRSDLLTQITRCTGMNPLLDLLGAEIDALGITDGYVVNLCDMARENLRTVKLRYPDGYRHLETTYHNYKTNLGTERHAPVIRAFFGRTEVRIDAQAELESDRKIVNGWKLTELTALPLLDSASPEHPPIGVVSLMKSSGRVSAEALQQLSDLLSLFYVPLQTALEADYLKQFHENFQLAAKEHERALQFIVEVTNLTNRAKIFDLFTKELFKRLDFDCIGLYLLEDNLLKNVMVSCADPAFQPITEAVREYLQNRPYTLDNIDGGISHAFLKNAAFVFSDVQEILHLPMSAKDKHVLSLMNPTRTSMLQPIRYQGHAIGVMTLSNLTKVIAVPESDLHLLNTLSGFFGAAITNSDNFAAREAQNAEIERLNQVLQQQVVELAEQAGTDRLTGLYNFRIFEREIDRRISECKRSSVNNGISIAVIDIDHFKRFNDTYGHQAGNQVLAGVAQEISKLVRKMDMAFRFGGEEFVVMMSKCHLEGSKTFAERVRTAVENAKFETNSGTLSVTVSVGCATYENDDTQETFFKRADQALYKAKNDGRNRVEG